MKKELLLSFCRGKMWVECRTNVALYLLCYRLKGGGLERKWKSFLVFAHRDPPFLLLMPRLEWLMHEMPRPSVVNGKKEMYCIFSYCVFCNVMCFLARLIPIIQSNFGLPTTWMENWHHLHTKARIMTTTTSRRKYCNALKKLPAKNPIPWYSLMTQFTTIEDELLCV